MNLKELIEEIRYTSRITKTEIAKRIGYSSSAPMLTAVKKNRMQLDKEETLLKEFGYKKEYTKNK
jgi:hypothetical protein